MPVVFAGPPGRVVAVADAAVQGFVPPLADLKPEALGFTTQRSIITRVTLGQEANYQFLHAIGGDIYVYVFGDRIGQLTLTGLCFAAACPDEGGDNAGVGNRHGMELTMQWYQRKKISKFKDLVTCMVGLTPVAGFVVGINLDVIDPKLMLVQFQLTMMVPPDRE